MEETKPFLRIERALENIHRIREKMLEKWKVGNTIAGRFVIHQIKSGGMGIVFIYYDSEFQLPFALKTVKDKYLWHEKIKENFKREALAWNLLDKHPNIVQLAYVEKFEERLFIVMEYIPPDYFQRSTLADYLVSPMNLRQCLQWGIDFCHGMEHAKAHGISAHRDIKPQNILIAPGGRLKITDFGLAKIWDGVDVPLSIEKELRSKEDLGFMKTKGGSVAGTLPYMAPEQFEGYADVRSDIYAFGIVLYQMASGGSLPFITQGLENWRKAHQRESPEQLNSKLFPIISQCLNKDPTDRFQNFGDLRKAIGALYLKVIGKEPSSPPQGRMMNAAEHMHKGVSFASIGLLNKAFAEYQEAIRLQPDLAEAYFNWGKDLFDNNQIESAIPKLQEAIRLNPNYREAYTYLGVAYYLKGLFESAIDCHQKAIQLNPNSFDNYYYLGRDILDEFMESLDRKSNLLINVDISEFKSHLDRFEKSLGRLDNAIASFKKAIRLKPDFPDAYYLLGRAFEFQGELDKAIDAYQKALSIKPDWTDVQIRLASALINKE